MNQFYPVLKTTPLFNQFEDDELSHMLSCLRANLIDYKKEETVLLQGNTIFGAGIIVNGSVFSQRENIDGNKIILSSYNTGDMFGEELLLSGITVVPFSLIANELTSIIYIDCSEISKFCKLSCVHHSKLVINLTQMLSAKIIQMDRKMDIVQKRTIREKLMAYFNYMAEQEGSAAFEIPFSRQGLADYIGVNRSAVSRELWKMQKDGIISFNNRYFTLHVLKNTA